MLCHWTSGSQHSEALSSSWTPQLLKMKEPQSLRMSGIIHQPQHHIPEDLNLQTHCSESPTSHNSTWSLYTLVLDTQPNKSATVAAANTSDAVNPLTPNDLHIRRRVSPLNSPTNYTYIPNSVLKLGGILFTPIRVTAVACYASGPMKVRLSFKSQNVPLHLLNPSTNTNINANT